MKYSRAQFEAINLKKSNILVSAAAGSGKTAVLVERVINKITLLEENVDIDRLLVITFTNKAASEMRSRISKALEERASCQNSYEYLKNIKKQQLLLNAASISTIHSFCQTVIKRYFYILNVDPMFKIANQTEIDLLKNSVLEEVIENGLTDLDDGIELLVEYYDTRDNELFETVFRIYEIARAQTNFIKWLESLRVYRSLESIDDSPYMFLLKERIILKLKKCFFILENFSDKIKDIYVYEDSSREDIILIKRLLEATELSFDEMRAVFQDVKFTPLKRLKKDDSIDELLKEEFQKSRDKVKKEIREISEFYLKRDSKALKEDVERTYPLINTLIDTIIKFDEIYSERKKEKSIVDFNDLEQFAFKILTEVNDETNEIIPSQVALELQNKYNEIIVDEYQDINPLQEAIIKILSNETKNTIFMVGDVKQSIYKFRLADVDIFLEKYNKYLSYTEEAPETDLISNRLIQLNTNYRSTEGIINAINSIFAPIMTKETSGIDYGEKEKLNASDLYNENLGKDIIDVPVEIYLFDKEDSAENESEESLSEDQANELESFDDLSDFEKEAYLIAEKIKELVRDKEIYDKEKKMYRKIKYKDIAILLRATKYKSQMLEEVFKKSGIPSYAEFDGGYFKETEVMTMVSLLKIIDNPYQDLDLVAVLRSPIVDLSEEELAEIRLNLPQGEFYEAVKFYLEKEEHDVIYTKLDLFLKNLEKWRVFLRNSSLKKLIFQIYRDTNFYDYLAGTLNGSVRQANLRALYERAGQYENSNVNGLFGFIRFLDNIKENKKDLNIAKSFSETEDVVKILSIHKSKGLEFEVVILADLNKKFNLQDTKSLFVCHKELGIAPYVFFAEERLRYPSFIRHAISYKIEREAKEEELRVLYVALTRARQKLILTGCAKDIKSRLARSISLGLQENDISFVLNANNYLDLILYAISKEKNSDLFKINIKNDFNVFKQDKEKITDEILNKIKNLNFIPSLSKPQEIAEIDNILDYKYEYDEVINISAKLTVTEIKRYNDILERKDSAELKQNKFSVAQDLIPRFLQTKKVFSGADYGKTIHDFLQKIDFTKDLSKDGLLAQALELKQKEVLSEEQVKIINYESVEKFFLSDLGTKILECKNIYREIPFSLMVNAKDIYRDLSIENEEIFVQGIIDVLFEENDGSFGIIDYKTDKILNIEDVYKKYNVQIKMYMLAVEKILNIKLKKAYIYSFYLGNYVII